MVHQPRPAGGRLHVPGSGRHARFQRVQEETALLPGYVLPSSDGAATPAGRISASAAGLVGALMTAALVSLVGGALWLFRRKPSGAHAA